MNDMKIKKGDMVRVSKDTPKLYTEGWSCNWLDCDLCVTQIDGDAAEVARINDNDEWFYLSIPCKYLVKVEAEAKEPTAPTIKVGDRVRCKNPIRLANSTDDDFIGTVTDAEKGWFIVHMNNGAIFQTYHESDLELVQPKEQAETGTDVLGEFTPIPRFDNPIIGFEQVYWREYEADLAREIAVKSMEKSYGCDPERIADYAVSVAKAVVEGLKGK